MLQPIADYNAGLFPSWQDCEAWRNGTPQEGYVWSYGASVATTTTMPQTTTSSSTTLPETTTSSSTTTTVPETTTTQGTTTTTTNTTTTTTQAPPPPPPPPPPAPTTTETTTTTTIQETTTIPETTTSLLETTTSSVVPVRTTLVETTTTTTPATTTTTEPPAQQKIVLAQQSESITESLNKLVADPSEITDQQAQEIFADLSVAELNEEQVTALVAAVQEAPESVRKTFEQYIDIYKEGLDEYVPVGSNIPVGQRRTIIAIGAAITIAGSATRMRQR